MSLVDKKSMLDRNVLGIPDPTGNLTDANGNPVGQNPASDGTYDRGTGKPSSSPFDIAFEDGGDLNTKSPLLALVRDNTVTSANSQIGLNSNQGGTGTYAPDILAELAPKALGFEDQDLDALTPTRYLDNLPPGA